MAGSVLRPALIATTALMLCACEAQPAHKPDATPVAEPLATAAAPDPLARPEPSDAKPSGTPPASEPAPTGSVLINQHGFLQRGPKSGLIVSSAPAPIPFSVQNARGQTVFSGQSTRVTPNDPQSGLPLHRIEFSDLRVSGDGMRIAAAGQLSDPFRISARPFAQLSRDSLNYFYQSRFAEPVEAAFVPAQDPPLSRAAGHADRTHTCFSGTDTRGTNWPGCSYTLTTRGGWYDAGDYGQYSANTGFAVWMMLNMNERRKTATPHPCPMELVDDTLVMPEAGNGRADLLDEARRGVENLLSIQVTSTTPMSLARGPQPATGPLRLTATNPAGLVHHKVHGIRWPGSEVTPATDTIPRRLFPPTTAATLHLAAVGASCSRNFRNTDRDLAARCLAAARTAFAAAERVPDAYAWGEFTGGGPYDDQALSDEFGWAAAELWLATDETAYRDAMLRYVPEFRVYGAFDWRNLDNLAVMSLSLHDDPRAVTALRALAERYAGEADDSAVGVPWSSPNFYWGSNGTMMNRAVVLGHAADRFGEPRYTRALVGSLDYVLGRNPLSRSYVTGYGARPMRNPHHRVWRNGEDATQPAPPPGVLSGGPNSVNFIDPIGSTLRGQCTGMTCWRDVYATYSMNEVAINWNAALAWTAHWIDRQSPSCSGER